MLCTTIDGSLITIVSSFIGFTDAYICYIEVTSMVGTTTIVWFNMDMFTSSITTLSCICMFMCDHIETMSVLTTATINGFIITIISSISTFTIVGSIAAITS
jgi:hypothetical protein